MRPKAASIEALRFLAIAVLSNLLTNCASKPVVGDIILDDFRPSYENEFDFSTADKVREQIKVIGSLKETENQRKFIKLLVAFYNINKANHVIQLPARTKTTLKFNSLCASSHKAIPVQNEIFQWVLGQPDIQMMRQILPLINSGQIDAHSAQEMIWNLENRTYYEDYPENIKKLLNKSDPNAKLILPSRIKTQIIDEILPQELEKAKGLLKGQYYELTTFKERIESLKSKAALPSGYFASHIPNTHVLAQTVSNGYETQTITLINPENKKQNLAVSNYFLKPVRPDIQPIILSSNMPHLEEIKRIMEDSSLKLLGYMASQYPTLNASEKALVKKYPVESAIVFYNAIIAENNAESLYPESGVNGVADAFRHYVWSGLVTRDLDESTAREFLAAHESDPGQPQIEREMDEFNNDRGILAAKDLLDLGVFEDEKLFKKAASEISAGSLRILNDEK